MKNLLPAWLFFVALPAALTLNAQVVPSIQWQKSLGGSVTDYASSIQQTTDGGYIVAGQSSSSDGDVSVNHGQRDYWIVKLDTAGALVWQKDLGGSDNDEANSIQQTADGGYIVAGYTRSNDNDVSENHGLTDYWIIKLEADGSIAWQKSLGGAGVDKAHSVGQTADGGYLIAGISNSTDGDVTGNQGDFDYWIVKLSADGDIDWQKTLGGSNYDEAFSAKETTDGGYIITGNSYSNNGDVTANHGSSDYWVVKLDSDRNLVWQKSLGGSNDDVSSSVEQTTDGGYVVEGYTNSTNGNVTGNHGSNDYWVVKLDAIGNIVWKKCFGGSGFDTAFSLQQTTGDGFIVAGYSNSAGGDVTGNNGSYDYWIVKLDMSGILEWQKSMGGSGDEIASCASQTSDGGFIVSGSSTSSNGDVSGNQGFEDYWIVTLTSDVASGVASLSNDFFSLSPNPVQTQLTLVLHNFSEGGINFATTANELSIRVYDLQGKIIALPATIKNTQVQLNTTTLPNGFYTLQIINNETGESEVAKFVKQ